METITPPPPQKWGVRASVKKRLAIVWNALLPNTIDIHWMMVLGKLELIPLSISTCYDGWGGYSENPKKEYLPEVTLLEIGWHHSGRRRLLGYQLVADWEFTDLEEGEDGQVETETWYWHRVSVLFMNFYFEADGLLKLKWR